MNRKGPVRWAGTAAAVGEPATIAASIPDLLVHHSSLASVRAAIDGRSVP